jgi:hypothetical protein
VGADPWLSLNNSIHDSMSEDEGDRWRLGCENPELSPSGTCRYLSFWLHVTLAPGYLKLCGTGEVNAKGLHLIMSDSYISEAERMVLVLETPLELEVRLKLQLPPFRFRG